MLILTSVDVLVDQRKKFNCIRLIPGKLMTANNCMCEHSYRVLYTLLSLMAWLVSPGLLCVYGFGARMYSQERHAISISTSYCFWFGISIHYCPLFVPYLSPNCYHDSEVQCIIFWIAVFLNVSKSLSRTSELLLNMYPCPYFDVCSH